MSKKNRRERKADERSSQHSNAKMGKRARAKLAQHQAEAVKAAKKFARQHPRISESEFHRLMKAAKGG